MMAVIDLAHASPRCSLPEPRPNRGLPLERRHHNQLAPADDDDDDEH